MKLNKIISAIKSFHPKFHLRITLVTLFILQILYTASLVGYLSFRSGEKAVNDLATQLWREITARIEGEFSNYLEAPHFFNQINTGTFSEGNFDLVNGRNGKQFITQLQFFPFIYSSYCGDSQGQFLGAYRPFYQSSSTIVMGLSNKESNYKLYHYAVDSQGNRQQLLQKFNSYDPRQRSWYIDAVAAKRGIWSKVYLGFSNSLPMITASKPVYDKSGKNVLGVCATDIVLAEDLTEFLASLSIGKTGRAFIIDRTGILISSSTNEPLTAGKGKNAKLVIATKSIEPHLRETARYLQKHFGSFDRIKKSEQLNYQLHGERYYVQALPLNDKKGIDWLIVVVVPESDFMAQINADTRNTIWLTLASLVGAIAIGILTARSITNPILRLTQASKELADGNLNQRTNTKKLIEIEEIETLEKSFNSMAGQLQESFETLEDKVKERTVELATANEEISQLNHRLKQENLRMGAELDVARQIQSMLLPKPEELNIEGLDIAGYMEPADEVGGDYYDVLQTDGIVTLGIGDVTGHGLESGILMLMTQTAVRTLQESREANPVIFLDTLNRTIYQNVQRMNSDKSLTLLIANYVDGKISISGQHEETLIVRKDGQVERIDTMDLGFPIGLDGDIADFISHATFELEPGEGIVLYTDGIPEAKDMDKVMYEVERLCAVISENWDKSAGEIKDAIIADVRRHIGKQKVFDDITLLVLKRQ
ncbi:serine/threonine protein phosphatase [Oscillatoriales cyanobacterium USR001]|nr:serine/threonine protein phosphatase [Oscillatoriales cyanobacterium USR001]